MSSNSEICKARTLYITRGILNREIIPTNIIYSWVRSKLHNISFELLEIKNHVKPFDILRLDTQGSSIIKYLRTVKLEDSIVYLTESDGTVIFNTDSYSLDLPIFTSLSEENIGTNAGGVAIITGESITVSGCEHYNKVLINYMSSSVVIESEFGSGGYIITIITPNKLDTSHNRLYSLVLDQFSRKDEGIDVLTAIEEEIVENEHVNPVKTASNPPYVEKSENALHTSNINECKVFTLSIMEKKMIEEALMYYNWNLKKSAEALGIGRSTLYRKLKEYELNKNN